MGVDLLVSTGIVGVAFPRAAAVGMPAGRVCVIVVDTLPCCVSGQWGGAYLVVRVKVVLVVVGMVVMALLSWIVQYCDFLKKL